MLLADVIRSLLALVLAGNLFLSGACPCGDSGCAASASASRPPCGCCSGAKGCKMACCQKHGPTKNESLPPKTDQRDRSPLNVALCVALAPLPGGALCGRCARSAGQAANVALSLNTLESQHVRLQV